MSAALRRRHRSRHDALARSPSRPLDGGGRARRGRSPSRSSSRRARSRRGRSCRRSSTSRTRARARRRCPGTRSARFAVGEHARARGVDAPARVIASAKSWLCAPRRRPRAGRSCRSARPRTSRRSRPVEASWRYLEHLARGVGRALRRGRPGARAREAGGRPHGARVVRRRRRASSPSRRRVAAGHRGRHAARGAAGRALRVDRRRGRRVAQGGRAPATSILVVDVGGGTTDFSAIAARREGRLARARARRGRRPHPARRRQHGSRARAPRPAEARGGGQGSSTAGSWRASRTRAAPRRSGSSRDATLAARADRDRRRAARSSLGGDAPHRADARGGRRARSSTASSPRSRADARPSTRARAALTQLGLPYALGPGRHAAPRGVPRRGRPARSRSSRASRRARATRRAPTLLHPTARALQRRRDEGRPRCATALVDDARRLARRPTARRRCACSTGPTSISPSRAARRPTALARRGRGLRIRGGTARAYYVGIESAVPAVPGRRAAGHRALRRAVRHGGGHGGRAAAARARRRRRRAGALPLLRLERAARGRGRRRARATGRRTSSRSSRPSR